MRPNFHGTNAVFLSAVDSVIEKKNYGPSSEQIRRKGISY